MLVSLLAFLLSHFGHICAAVEFTLKGSDTIQQLYLPKSSFDLSPLWYLRPPSFSSEFKNYLKELDSYAGKHEIQQQGDQDDVTNCFDGHKYALDHMLSYKTNKIQ